YRFSVLGRARLVVFVSSRRRHTSSKRDWSSDVCSSDLSFPATSCTSRIPILLMALACSLSARALKGTPSRAQVMFSPMLVINFRSEERRVGKEFRDRGSEQQCIKTDALTTSGKSVRVVA